MPAKAPYEGSSADNMKRETTMKKAHHFPTLHAFGIVLVALYAVVGFMATSARAENDVLAPSGYSEVDSTHLTAMLQSKDFLLVNVHVPYEGEIAGTDAHVPFDRIREFLASFPADKNARIVLYCMSDRMSGIAAEVLVQIGYKNVVHLVGGIIYC